jgi:predicted AlkP superfamily pyrophosphatase or phosphodiesterase
MNKLAEHKLNPTVIISSDHGMAEVNTLDSIDLNALLGQIPSSATVVENSIISFIHLPATEIESTYLKIKALERNFKVYKKGEMSKKWHFNSHYRIGDLVLLANPGYAFRKTKVEEKITGEHGYDPYTTPDMHGIFYAKGPNIKVNRTVKSVENVNIFPLITKILDFENPEIDGRFRKVKAFYKK